MTKRIVTLLLVFTLVFGLASALTFNASAATVEGEYDLFEGAKDLWVKSEHEGANCNIDYADGYARIYGSDVNKWPSCTATFSEAVVVTPGTALVYDISFATGKISFVLNGQSVNALITDNIESTSNDMFSGEYKGAVKFEDLAAVVGTDADGNIAITSFQVYTVDGADCTASLKFVSGYEFPEVSDEVSEDAPVDESEPADDESTPADESKPADDTSAPATDNGSDVSESNGSEAPSNTWVWILVAVVVVIVVVVVVVVSKKKK